MTQEAYFQKPKFKLYLADSLEFLKELPENSVDMIFADPPYNLSNGGFTCQNGQMVSVNKGQWDVSKGLKQDFEFHLNWIQACKRVLKPNGTIWISGTYHSIYQCGFALQVAKFHILNDISWFNNRKMPSSFFEVEHSTDMQNSLVKFVDLQDFNVNFFIVADQSREKEFKKKISYNAFSSINVDFMDYERLSELHAKSFEIANLEKNINLNYGNQN